MYLMFRYQIDDTLTAFEKGEISKKEALWRLAAMPENPNFKGIWEILLIHIALIEVTKGIQGTDNVRKHWSNEIKAWQKRINRFINKPKASFRNAVKKHFFHACEDLFKDEYADIIFQMEMHMEDYVNVEKFPIGSRLSKMDFNSKDMEWFLTYG